MPASQVWHKFFSQSLDSVHQYRRNALPDMTVALTRGALLSLTSIGRYLPGPAGVKHKIKPVDRHLNSELMFGDIPCVYQQRVSRLTHSLSVCIIAADWSGYPSSELRVLRASLCVMAGDEEWQMIRQSPKVLSGMNPNSLYADTARACKNIIMVY